MLYVQIFYDEELNKRGIHTDIYKLTCPKTTGWLVNHKQRSVKTNLGDCFEMLSSDRCRFVFKSHGLGLLGQTVQKQQRQEFNLRKWEAKLVSVSNYQKEQFWVQPHGRS